jgi:hypothetical protein
MLKTYNCSIWTAKLTMVDIYELELYIFDKLGCPIMNIQIVYVKMMEIYFLVVFPIH